MRARACRCVGEGPPSSTSCFQPTVRLMSPTRCQILPDRKEGRRAANGGGLPGDLHSSPGDKHLVARPLAPRGGPSLCTHVHTESIWHQYSMLLSRCACILYHGRIGAASPGRKMVGERVQWLIFSRVCLALVPPPNAALARPSESTSLHQNSHVPPTTPPRPPPKYPLPHTLPIQPSSCSPTPRPPTLPPLLRQQPPD